MRIKDKKKFVYRILQIIMGLSLIAVFVGLAMVAEFPDWSAQAWAVHFCWTGVCGGIGLMAWLAAVLLGWAGGNNDDKAH